MRYADVIVEAKSEKVDRPFTYICPFDDAKIGSRLKVPFRGSKPRFGYIVDLFSELPDELKDKKILTAEDIDRDASLDESSVKEAMWMRRRYFCRHIEALHCFAPAGSPSKRGKKRRPAAHLDDSAAVPPELTGEQSEVLQRITEVMRGETENHSKAGKGVFLLHGVTGSGKTEVYLRCVSEALSLGKQAIVLVPEISLTPQTIGRFTARFGEEKVAVLHSRLSIGERYDEWIRIKRGEASICVGARSAVFAPVTSLGVIIVDEEHETTYKSDSAPKYDAIEVAIKRSLAAGAVCVLGSATPSIVSMYRARSGLYTLLRLTQRVGGAESPTLTIADMRTELMEGNKSIFSKLLHSQMEESLAEGKQTLLFLNRRGYSPSILCRSCGYVLKCEECGLTLSYHKKENLAVCHFCGRSRTVPDTCPACESQSLRHFGTGTEKVEELTVQAFPEASIARLDMDTSSKKGGTHRILSDFEKGKTNILVGTQMIAKGLDFKTVNPVGILAADVGLNIPDFRSAERTFQLIIQAAGRAGRGTGESSVIVQTYSPEAYAISYAVKNDYEGFYETEIMLRKSMSYPPYSDIIRLTCYASSSSVARRGADNVRSEILSRLGRGERRNLLGPQEAAIPKLGDDFRYCLYVKVLPAKRRVYENLLADIKQRNNTDDATGFRLVIDTNPFSLL